MIVNVVTTVAETVKSVNESLFTLDLIYDRQHITFHQKYIYCKPESNNDGFENQSPNLLHILLQNS